MLAVRESAVFRRLDREGPRADEPRAIGKLRPQQEADTPLILRAGNGVPGGLQRNQRLPGRIRVRLERRQLRPPSVRSLQEQAVTS